MGGHMVGASLRLAGRQESCRDSWGCALTSKWQVGVLLWEHRGWILRIASLYKGQTVCRMQAIRHENLSGFLQNSDRKPVGLSFRPKRQVQGQRLEVGGGCGRLL